MTSDRERADGIVDEIAQKGVSLDDKQWDFAVGAIAAALASVREEEREACAKVAESGRQRQRIVKSPGRFGIAMVEPRLAAMLQDRKRIAAAIRSRQTPTGTGESRG